MGRCVCFYFQARRNWWISCRKKLPPKRKSKVKWSCPRKSMDSKWNSMVPMLNWQNKRPMKRELSCACELIVEFSKFLNWFLSYLAYSLSSMWTTQSIPTNQKYSRTNKMKERNTKAKKVTTSRANQTSKLISCAMAQRCRSHAHFCLVNQLKANTVKHFTKILLELELTQILFPFGRFSRRLIRHPRVDHFQRWIRWRESVHMFWRCARWVLIRFADELLGRERHLQWIRCQNHHIKHRLRAVAIHQFTRIVEDICQRQLNFSWRKRKQSRL